MSSCLQFKEMAAPLVHNAVLDIISALQTKGKVLDIPAGEGALAARLYEKGFDVIAADFLPENFKPSFLDCLFADMNKVLPFNDNTFDLVTCVEGIEHIENPSLLLREFARILKPSGYLILTTPNIHNVVSRLRFLLTGKFEKFGDRFLDEHKFCDIHISPINYDILIFLLKRAGLQVEGLSTNRTIYSMLQSPLLKFLARVSSLLIKQIAKMRKATDQESMLFCSDELLLGEIAILRCKKV